MVRPDVFQTLGLHHLHPLVGCVAEGRLLPVR